MSQPRSAARTTAVAALVVTLFVSLVGFAVTLVLNAFVLDKYEAYGKVPVPGRANLQLPAGELTVSFYAQTIGTNDGALPIPDLSLRIIPPPDAPKPELIERIGSTTSFNSESRRQVWTVRIPVQGDYRIETDGNVSAFITPRLAFGHNDSVGWLVWLFVGLFAAGVVGIFAVQATGRRPPDQQVETLADTATEGAPQADAVDAS